MKLLIASDAFIPRWDGVARFLYEIIPLLKEYEITVVAPDYGEIENHFGKMVDHHIAFNNAMIWRRIRPGNLSRDGKVF